jgi:hypothetical protein
MFNKTQHGITVSREASVRAIDMQRVTKISARRQDNTPLRTSAAWIAQRRNLHPAMDPGLLLMPRWSFLQGLLFGIGS